MPPGDLDTLYRRTRPALIAAVTRLLGPSQLAEVEGIVQETFVAALRAWSGRKPPENPDGWLFQVARNRALDWIRTGGRHQRSSDHDEALLTSLLDPESGPLTSAEARLRSEL